MFQYDKDYDVKHNIIGKMLPDKIGKYEIKCKDEELKEKLELVVCIMNDKVMSGDSSLGWTEKEFKEFRNQLVKFPVSLFNNFYDYILYYLRLSKVDLEKEIRKLDDSLELHIFDDERLLINKEYTYLPHVFTPTDLIKCFKNLYSKTMQFCCYTVNKYQNEIGYDKSEKEQLEDIKLLLELFNDSDKKVLNSLEDEYYNWINKLSSDSNIYTYLINMKAIIIEANKYNLKKKMAELNERIKDVHTEYAIERNVSINCQKAKGIKSGFKY